MVAVVDLFDNSREFATQSLVQPDTEDLANSVRRQPPQADFAASFKDFVNGSGV